MVRFRPAKKEGPSARKLKRNRPYRRSSRFLTCFFGIRSLDSMFKQGGAIRRAGTFYRRGVPISCFNAVSLSALKVVTSHFANRNASAREKLGIVLRDPRSHTPKTNRRKMRPRRRAFFARVSNGAFFTIILKSENKSAKLGKVGRWGIRQRINYRGSTGRLGDQIRLFLTF